MLCFFAGPTLNRVPASHVDDEACVSFFFFCESSLLRTNFFCVSSSFRKPQYPTMGHAPHIFLQHSTQEAENREPFTPAPTSVKAAPVPGFSYRVGGCCAVCGVVVVLGWLARWEDGCAPSGVRPLRAPGERETLRRGPEALRRWRRRRPRGVAAPAPRRPSPLRCACRPRAARWPSPPRPSSTRPWPRAPSRARRAPPRTAARA